MERVAEVLGVIRWSCACKQRQPHRRHDGQPRRHARPVDGPGHPRRGRSESGYELGDEYWAMDSERRTRRPAARAPRGAAGPRGRPHDVLPHHQRRRALMAIHRGRGFATIEYPTGMNQNGDPSQAWIKLKPDGRVDVFAGTVDIGQGSKTVHTQIVADALGVPYETGSRWTTRTPTRPPSARARSPRAARSSAATPCASPPRRSSERILDIASKELEIAPDDLEIVDGEVIAKGAPDRKISVADVAGAATYAYGELISGHGHGAQAAGRGQRRRRLGHDRAALGDLLRRVRRRRRGRRRDRRGRPS